MCMPFYVWTCFWVKLSTSKDIKPTLKSDKCTFVKEYYCWLFILKNCVLPPPPHHNSICIEGGGYCFETSSLVYDEDKIHFFKLIQKSSWFKICQGWLQSNGGIYPQIFRFSTYIFLKIFNKSFKLFLIYVGLLKLQKTKSLMSASPKIENWFGNERLRNILDKANKDVSATQILKYLLGVFLRSQDKAHYFLFSLILR